MNDNDGKVDARAEAAQWYARLQSLPVSLKTLEAYFAWRSLPGNEDAFLAVDELHSATDRLAGRPSIQAAAEAAYQRGLGRGHDRRSRVAWAGGMAALLVAGAAFFLCPSSHEKSFSTRVGEQREVALEDGSIVKLDTNSAVSSRFTQDARRIHLLRGQAYFTVAHNAKLPFIVDAGPVSIVATGTQFDVRRTSDQIDVTLVQGGVDIRAGESLSHLGPGQKMRIVPGKKPVPEAADMASSTAWTHGRLMFDNVTLAQAVEEVNRYASRPVRLDNPSFADAKFSGSLATGDIPSFVAAVTAILPLRAVTDETDSIHMVG